MQEIEKLLTKIKSRGYWKIILRPTQYKEDCIPSLEECKNIIQESKLSLRGWDYPHVDHQSGIMNASANSVYSYCDWEEGGKFEYWRFYKTGQFVHYFEMREDWELSEEKKNELRKEHHTKSEIFFSILSALYTITEIYEFSSRLISKIENIDGWEVIIELSKINNRTLFFWDSFFRTLYKAYTCHYVDDAVHLSKIIAKEDLLKNSDKLALEQTIKIFKEVFGWEGANESIFKEDQKKLLERRL